MDEFTKIVPSAFEPFIGQGLLACIKSVFSKSFFITLKYYVNAELDKTEMLMNLKKPNALSGNRILSRNIEYLKKKPKKHESHFKTPL